jgi:hypothetical protein
MSIHGEGLIQSGLVVTATCDDCHTAHRPLPADDEESTTHPDNVSATCGVCHHGIEEQFEGSVHWEGRDSHPELEYPTCEDCHTSHSIARTGEGNFRLTMTEQCGRCHVEETETFFDTFHGKVSRLGDDAAAKCYDCHGTHDIHPVEDPRSTLSRENVLSTCSQCHSNASAKFTGYLTHATHHDPEKYPWLFYSFWAMTLLLVGTLTVATRAEEGDLVLEAFKPGEFGEPMERSDQDLQGNAGNEALTLLLEVGDEFYFKVSAFSQGASIPYRLQVGFIPN